MVDWPPWARHPSSNASVGRVGGEGYVLVYVCRYMGGESGVIFSLQVLECAVSTWETGVRSTEASYLVASPSVVVSTQ